MNAQAMHKTHPTEAAARPAFGTVLASQMAVTDYQDGSWAEHEFCKYGPIEISPAIHGLHYGSTCFEGFKAYRWADGSVNIFRMDKHIARMLRSADCLVLPKPDPVQLAAMVTGVVDRVRKAVTRGKVLTDGWLEVNRVWHRLGGRSTCTMMFGHVETLQERIEHLERLRRLQDETGGFTAFICWTHQPPEHAPWFGRDAEEGRQGGIDMSRLPPAGAFEYLKTQAVARLYLDNIPNIQSSWVTQGEKIGQLALFLGANDMGSLMIEENVVAEAGTVHYLTLDQIRSAIEELGFTPRQRNARYEYVALERERFAIEANKKRQQVPLVQLAS